MASRQGRGGGGHDGFFLGIWERTTGTTYFRILLGLDAAR